MLAARIDDNDELCKQSDPRSELGSQSQFLKTIPTIYMCVCVDVRVCLCVCLYIYIYIYIYNGYALCFVFLDDNFVSNRGNCGYFFLNDDFKTTLFCV